MPFRADATCMYSQTYALFIRVAQTSAAGQSSLETEVVMPEDLAFTSTTKCSSHNLANHSHPFFDVNPTLG